MTLSSRLDPMAAAGEEIKKRESYEKTVIYDRQKNRESTKTKR